MKSLGKARASTQKKARSSSLKNLELLNSLVLTLSLVFCALNVFKPPQVFILCIKNRLTLCFLSKSPIDMFGVLQNFCITFLASSESFKPIRRPAPFSCS